MQIHTTFTIFVVYTTSSPLSNPQIRAKIKLNSILIVQVLNQNRLSLMNQRSYVRIRVVEFFSYIGTILAIQFVWHVYMIRMFNWPICS